jgi:homoaconitase/3-isopropylmalate dehydratase large subunit
MRITVTGTRATGIAAKDVILARIGEPRCRADIAPTVTWGTSPQDALRITGRVTDPAAEAHPARREALGRAGVHGPAPGSA